MSLEAAVGGPIALLNEGDEIKHQRGPSQVRQVGLIGVRRRGYRIKIDPKDSGLSER